MNTTATDTNVMEKMIDFVKSIGLPVHFAKLDEPTFLPGITLQNGGIVIDREKLLYPGDILHEAGHLAVMPPEIRANMNGDLNDGEENHDLLVGGEMMAIAWSYAACLHLNIDPLIVFHENGYKGGGANLVDNFNNGNYIATATLQWAGLCNEPKRIKEPGKIYYPQMLKWLR